MRIRAYVAGGLALVGLGALEAWLWSLSPWLALAWSGGALGLWALALGATSPTYWGQHGQRGPRARQDGRRRPNGAG